MPRAAQSMFCETYTAHLPPLASLNVARQVGQPLSEAGHERHLIQIVMSSQTAQHVRAQGNALRTRTTLASAPVASYC